MINKDVEMAEVEKLKIINVFICIMSNRIKTILS